MDSNFIRGVGKIGERLLILLNLDQLMVGAAVNEQTA
jgi:purine-binding chemotaxis protein CheW